jgi:hypothetical protein
LKRDTKEIAPLLMVINPMLTNPLGLDAISDIGQLLLRRGNEEEAQPSVAGNAFASNAVYDLMIRVKGYLSFPFFHVIFSHPHQDEIADLG